MPMKSTSSTFRSPPAVATRGVAWAAGGALAAAAGAIAGFHAIYQRAVPVETVPAPQAFPQPRVDTQDVAKLQRLRAAADQATGNLALGQRPAHARANPDRARHAAFGAEGRRRLRPAAAAGSRSSREIIRVAGGAVLCSHCAWPLAAPATAGFTSGAIEIISATPPPNAALAAAIWIFRRKRQAADARPTPIGGVPAVVIFADYTCRTLCGPILEFAAAALAKTGLQPGADYRLVVIGLDPKDGLETARAMRAAHIDRGNPIVRAAVFLSGNEAAIRRRDGGCRLALRL